MEVNLCFGCMEETAASPCPRCGYDPRQQANAGYALQTGTILHGKYLLGRVLGQGGFGITYIGWDLPLSRKVAIKEYFPAACVSRDTEASLALQWHETDAAREARHAGREMFLKEARKMTQVVSVEQVVHVKDIFEDNNTAYIVMEYVHGETLADRIRRTGPMPWKDVQPLLLSVATSLQKVHKAGLVHRDLSPDNLMLPHEGGVKILDLGAAKDMKRSSGVSSVQVARNGYSPIEQYTTRGNSGPWTDVYALAATVYFSLTGVTPPSAVERMSQDTLRWKLPQLRKVPTSVIRVLQKAMALQPKDRFQSMGEFAVCLRKAASGGCLRKLLLGTGIAVGAVVAAIVIWLLALDVVGLLLEHSPNRPTGLNPLPPEAFETETAPQETDYPWSGNVLMASVIPDHQSSDKESAPVLGSPVARYQITAVTFLDSTENAGADSWDVSHARDGSVIAWLESSGTVSEWINGKDTTAEAYHLYIAAENGINGTYCANLFAGFSNLESIHFGGHFHTDYATSMENMFSGCSALKFLNTDELVTGNVRNMRNMFQFCESLLLETLNFDTSNVENMYGMFSYCRSLYALDLRSFNTSKVKDMSNMFSSASNLTELEISSFDTSSVTNMHGMFSYSKLIQLDLHHFNTSRVTDMSSMFSGCKALKTLDIRGFDTSSVTNMSFMFSGCDSLEGVYGLTACDFSHVEYYTDFMDEGTLIDENPWTDLFE